MTSLIVNEGNRNPNELTVRAAASLHQRWLYLLPVIFITYSVAYVDRANFGFGVAAGLGVTLHIGERDSLLLAGLFFVSYFASQIPGAILTRKYSVNKIVPITLAAWGGFALLTGVIYKFWLLVLDRFLLGVAESIIFPVMPHLPNRWLTPSERSRANTFRILGNPSRALDVEKSRAISSST